MIKLLPRSPRLGAIVFDAALSEEHGIEGEITEHAIQAGGIFADHYRNRPRTLALELAITGAPGFPFGANLGALSVPSGLPGLRHVAAWAGLRQLWRLRIPFDVETGLTTYRNMAIVSARVRRDKDNSRGFVVSVQLREVPFAVVDAIDNVAEAAADLALGAADLGSQGLETVPEVPL